MPVLSLPLRGLRAEAITQLAAQAGRVGVARPSFSVPSGVQTRSGASWVYRPARQAVALQTAEQELFDKLLVQPQHLNLGVIPGDVEADLRLRNTSFSRPATVKDFTSNDLTVGVLDASPALVAPGGSVTRRVRIDGNGPLTLDAFVAFTADGEVRQLPVTGLRVEVLGARPEFESGFSVKRAYKTSILTAHGGKEQRSRLLKKPWEYWSFVVTTTTHEELQELESVLLTRHGKPVAIPDWRAARAVSSATEFFLACDTSQPGIEAGTPVILLLAGGGAQTLQVAGVGPDGLHLSTPFPQFARATGATVAPFRVGRITDSVSTDVTTLGVTQTRLTARLERELL